MKGNSARTGVRHWFSWDRIAIAIPYIWLLIFFALPFAIILKISVADPLIAQPPFTPLIDWTAEAGRRIYATLDNFLFVLDDRLYVDTYLNSVKLAGQSTLLTLLIGYPMAYGIARSPERTRKLLLLLVILPFWISFLLRVYAWMGILGTNGILNSILLWAGIVNEPLQILYTDTAVFLGIVYSFLPFMILPLYATLEKLDESLLEAAADLGATRHRVFLDITLPLSLPGIVAGSLLVFIPAMGQYVIPALLGGTDTLMIGRVIFDEFFISRDWPVASAIAIILLLLLVVPMMVFQRYQLRNP
jgi:putrescine transport system permease protein